MGFNLITRMPFCHYSQRTVFAKRGLQNSVRPLLMTKSTEIFIVNEITASAWERSQIRWRFRTRPADS